MKKTKLNTSLLCVIFLFGVSTHLGIAAQASGDSIDDAFRLYRSGKLGEAEKIAVRTMDAAIAAADTTTYIKSLCLQTDIAVDSGNDDEAAFFYNKCLELSGFGEPMFTLSSSLYNIAMIYYQNKEYVKAMEYAVKSINIDSQRENDSILALRYMLVGRILYESGEYEKAMEYIDKGKNLASVNKNNNVTGRFILLQTMCKEAMTKENPDWNALEAGYLEAYEHICLKYNCYHYGVVNPYLPEICYHLGKVTDTLGKDAKPYFKEAILIAGTSQKMRGDNPIIVIESSKELSEILKREGNLEEAAKYKSIADSLSFVPFINEMSTKISLSQIEFIRREKDREIENQKNKTVTMLAIAILLAVFAFLLSFLYRKQLLQKRAIEQQNAQLVKLNLQKDQLIEMIKEEPELSENNPRIEAIANDTVPLPEINLSKREKEIIEQCCKGLISKEIAANLDISVRTVEAHKSNIFRKLGISTTSELVAFAFKSGIIQ